jgi:hypothetical protein
MGNSDKGFRAGQLAGSLKAIKFDWDELTISLADNKTDDRSNRHWQSRGRIRDTEFRAVACTRSRMTLTEAI